MLKIKIVSGLEKPFVDDGIDNYEPLSRISALKGERLTLELLYTYEPDDSDIFRNGTVRSRMKPILR